MVVVGVVVAYYKSLIFLKTPTTTPTTTSHVYFPLGNNEARMGCASLGKSNNYPDGYPYTKLCVSFLRALRVLQVLQGFELGHHVRRCALPLRWRLGRPKPHRYRLGEEKGLRQHYRRLSDWSWQTPALASRRTPPCRVQRRNTKLSLSPEVPWPTARPATLTLARRKQGRG